MRKLRRKDRQLLTRIGLARAMRRDGGGSLSDAIQEMLAHERADEMIAIVGMQVEAEIAEPDDIVLYAEPGEFFLKLLDWFVNNGPALLELITKLLALFA